MELFGRQGDLVIEKLSEKLSGELTERADLVFAGDSSGHRHRLQGVALVELQRPGRTRFRLTKAADLAHEKADGHKTVSLEPGDYEVRSLRERGDASDRAVED